MRNYLHYNYGISNCCFRIILIGIYTFWFNTYKSGLCYLDGDTIIEYKFNKKLLEILGESYIQDLFIEDGELWFSITKKNGLYLFQILF